MAGQQTRIERRVDLDWVRIAAFGLLIFYHVGMLYVPWPYHVKSTQILPGLVPFMLVLNPWRLGLLFLVSGAATSFMLAGTSPLPLFARRSARLLVPLAFGMAVIVPPQSYLELVSRHIFAGDFGHFMAERYFAFGRQFCDVGHCLALPSWNHLWFVAYLWVYTAVLMLLVLLLPGVVQRVEAWSTQAMSGVGVVLLPAAVLVLYRLELFPHFPKTNALIGDWYNHALYFSLFVLGFLIARADPVWVAMARWRWAALAVAAAAFAGIMGVRAFSTPGAPVPSAVLIFARVAYGLYQWSVMVAVLGFARTLFTRESAVRRYLTDAIFPYYIMHQTIIVVVAYAVRDAGLPAWLEAGVVIAATALGCALTYEIVRRVFWLRPLFGLRWQTPGWMRLPGRGVAAGSAR